MSRPERKREIARLRGEGATAFANGLSLHAMPPAYMNTMNAHHWQIGWSEAKTNAKAAFTLLERIDNAETIEDVKDILREMYSHLDLK